MKVVETFEINYNRYLDENGKLEQTELPAFAKDPNNLVAMYKLMVRVRTFDARAVSLQRTGKMGTFAATLGQEAVSVGFGAAMRRDDVLTPTYREYGAQLQRGVAFQDILSFWGGDEQGSNFDHDSDFPICVPLSSQTLHATGVAKAIQLRKQDRVVIAAIGDGATSEGDFYEAINVAGVWKLPIVFIVTNNQWAISVPRNIQTAAQTFAQKALAAGFTGEQVDGNDVIAVRDAAEKAIANARAGNGPHLIEAITYRLCDHTTADDATRYREKEETDAAWQREPIKRLREYLISINAWDETQEKQLIDEATAEIEAATQDYLSRSAPPVAEMFDHLYENLPDSLIEQREEAIALSEN